MWCCLDFLLLGWALVDCLDLTLPGWALSDCLDFTLPGWAPFIKEDRSQVELDYGLAGLGTGY